MKTPKSSWNVTYMAAATSTRQRHLGMKDLTLLIVVKLQISPSTRNLICGAVFTAKNGWHD